MKMSVIIYHSFSPKNGVLSNITHNLNMKLKKKKKTVGLFLVDDYQMMYILQFRRTRRIIRGRCAFLICFISIDYAAC